MALFRPPTLKRTPPDGTKLKPWQRRSLRPRKLDVVVAGEGEPLMRLDIYEGMILVTRRTEFRSNGQQGVRARGRWTRYPIAAQALARQLGGIAHANGLLPLGTLADGAVGGLPFWVRYIPPRVITLHVPKHQYRFRTPPLVWGGCGANYRIFALGTDDYPQSEQLPLYVAPFPNTYNTGDICWGDVQRPKATATNLDATLDTFLQASYFNLHVADKKSRRYPVSVLALYTALHEESKARAIEQGTLGVDAAVPDEARVPYPLDDLTRTHYTLSYLTSGQAFAHNQRGMPLHDW